MPKYIALIAVLLLSNTANSRTNTDDFEPTKSACLAVSKKIKSINNKMKQGYSAAQGERYREKLRELKDKRYVCSKKGFKTD